MTPRTPHLPSKTPNMGTTIFTVMSALAAEKGAVNLGQGFPDFACDPRLVDAVTDAMREGLNQYPPMTGVPALRQALIAAAKGEYRGTGRTVAEARRPSRSPHLPGGVIGPLVMLDGQATTGATGSGAWRSLTGSGAGDLWV